MKRACSVLLIGALAIAGGPATADAAADHTVLAPEEMAWGPAPAAIPPGAEAVVLYGDPGKDGLFALRLRMPADEDTVIRSTAPVLGR